jgi:hypothetical protein
LHGRLGGVPRINVALQPSWARVREVLAAQGGAISVAQALRCGIGRGEIRRAADSGQWHRAHPGVYVEAGLVGDQLARMWAAHLALGVPSVVAGAAAGHYWGLLDGDLPPGTPVLMLTPEPAHKLTPAVLTRRVPDPLARAHPARRPPILTVEHAVLDLARIAPTDAQATEAILRACRERLTTPGRILATASSQARVRRRGLIASVCAEVRDGATSPLEMAYRRRVALPHGLPRARAQVRADHAGGTAYRDLVYEDQAVIVELDGRRGHQGEASVFRDQCRDNHATLTGQATLRYGWVAVMGQPCAVALQVGSLLVMRGWSGVVRPCGPGCPAAIAAAS